MNKGIGKSESLLTIEIIEIGICMSQGTMVSRVFLYFIYRQTYLPLSIAFKHASYPNREHPLVLFVVTDVLPSFLFSGVQLEVPLTWFNVTKGETVRFRVIGVGSIYPLRISVDQHNLTVISSDAFDIEGTLVESFIINPGERFDFLLTANQELGNYWIRAVSMEVCFCQIYLQKENFLTVMSRISLPLCQSTKNKIICRVLLKKKCYRKSCFKL